MSRTAWVDLASPSHPFFFRALTSALPNLSVETTARQKTETVDLAKGVGFNCRTIGRDFNNPFLRKIGIPLRTGQLILQAPTTDVSLSSRNAMCVLASKARNIPSIHFTDNDITAYVDGLQMEQLYNYLEARATHNVVPAAFQTTELSKWGADPGRIHTYDGYKEDVYVAEFEPDDSFTEALPFEEFIVVRPEALDAAYVDASRSLVPDIFEQAISSGFNVVYLPRGRGDKSHAARYPSDRVHIPAEPLDGLQLAWHAQCVLTGSGTMAREAACMEKPAVSFFPNTLLSVDQELYEEDRIFWSRDADRIGQYLRDLSAINLTGDRSRSRSVKKEVVSLTERLIRQETEE